MPRTTKHKIITEIEREIDADTVKYPSVEIEFSFYPGCAAYTPRGEYAPIDPPEPAEVEFISATLVDSDGMEITQDEIDKWGERWLENEGHDWAMYRARDDRQARED